MGRKGLIVFCARFASCALDKSMRNICARLCLFPQCAIYAQDLRKIVLIFPMRNICTRFVQDCAYFPQCEIYAQDLRKIVVISPMCNICIRLAQDCAYFPNVQYMRKICTRLYLSLQCAIYVQDLRKIVLISLMRNICARFNLFSPMRNICSRFVQDCSYFSNAQYMHKI